MHVFYGYLMVAKASVCVAEISILVMLKYSINVAYTEYENNEMDIDDVYLYSHDNCNISV